MAQGPGPTHGGQSLNFVLYSFPLAQAPGGIVAGKGLYPEHWAVGGSRFLRTLGPPGQTLPALPNWVKVRPPRRGGRAETQMDETLGGLSCCRRPGGKVSFNIIFKQLQFLGNNYFLSPLGISHLTLQLSSRVPAAPPKVLYITADDPLSFQVLGPGPGTQTCQHTRPGPSSSPLHCCPRPGLGQPLSSLLSPLTLLSH